MRTTVDLRPFREAYERQHEREGLTPEELGYRMGLSRDRAATLVGQKDAQRRCGRDSAAKLCRALHLWPCDIEGL